MILQSDNTAWEIVFFFMTLMCVISYYIFVLCPLALLLPHAFFRLAGLAQATSRPGLNNSGLAWPIENTEVLIYDHQERLTNAHPHEPPSQPGYPYPIAGYL